MATSTYKANAYLLHQGKRVDVGEEVQLTDEQAKPLLEQNKVVKPGETVTAANGGEVKTEKSLEDMTLTELKEIAKAADIDGYSSMKKEELIAAIEKSRQA